MKSLWVIAAVVVIIAGLAGVAFFTHLEKPQQSQASPPTEEQADPQAMMAQVSQQVEALKQKIEKNPKDVQAYIDLGNMYFDANMPPQAIEHYTKALELEPDNSNVWTDLGTMHRHNGDLDKAIECYQKAAKIDPKNKNAWFNLGIVYKFDKNQPKEALSAWKKFLENVSPDDPHYKKKKKEVSNLEAQIK